MTRILLVAQDKGGVGKTLLVRAAAEAVPEAPVIAIDATNRLLELESRVTFLPMRADRQAIEASGGRAARAEYDPVVDALAQMHLPTLVDIGANTSRSLLALMAEVSDPLRDAGAAFGVVIVVTAEPGALAEAPVLLELVQPFAEKIFVVENRVRGVVDEAELRRLSNGHVLSRFERHEMEDEAVKIVEGGGLALIPRLDTRKLIERHGISRANRIERDLARFRLDAMEAMRPAVEWLVG